MLIFPPSLGFLCSFFISCYLFEIEEDFLSFLTFGTYCFIFALFCDTLKSNKASNYYFLR